MTASSFFKTMVTKSNWLLTVFTISSIRLEIVAMNYICQSMHLPLIFNFGHTSKRMESVVQILKDSSQCPNLNFYDGYCTIDFWNNKQFKVVCNTRGYKIEDRKQRFGLYSTYHLLHTKEGTIIENTVRALNQLKKMFKFNMVFLNICTKTIKVSFFEELFSKITFNPGYKITMDGVKFDLDVVNYLLNTLKAEDYFVFWNSDMPSDFKHENAFKLQGVVYMDGRWVQVEDVLKIQGADFVHLHETNFTVANVHEIIDRWINSEVDMFKNFNAQYLFDDFLPNAILDDLIGFEQMCLFGPMFFTLAKSTSAARVDTVLAIAIRQSYFILCAWKPTESFPVEYAKGDAYKDAYKILTILNKKDKLEKEMKQETDGYERNRLAEEIQELVEKMWDLGGRFENGKVYVDR
ncbi:hypothetical protein GCK72_003760 [Caenorhabditis remanei]|uniref:F-box associated domain-containing protein n=1 Tax=Caenorhabditis remanei TaxID=31234 RepID=A0A6A5H9G1_CAERE|nr:hypothetical protein GCK72_003760 [Caenorhabditis remanei]KAF1763815.1 hypothetical protein GCK72_003760 [Caenorhabditis remanei]